ncbi:MAG: bifunctional phosphopantothenoylcysteine decarboxylase/phosphopantothenate--cysteine ligase CoaBC [Desulfurispora sp.]|uniref:bifunctional phosphopantothenoylcysteine decarboxylase/phosphopantothenate--cysteine ligase CoaBC n=1 Tax=Desulfurispora sp. TaxID=3014275 RepID=UPI00404B916E
MLQGKQITLGVSGGIAAYKVADLASKLTARGAAVHVILTAAAAKFVGPVTFAGVTGNPVHQDLFAGSPDFAIPHIDLASRADLLVIAPATANVLAKLAAGLADDLLSATALAATCPVLVCPAMNAAMYRHPAVQKNLQVLRSYGYHILEPASGRMACGTVGQGRLPEPAVILEEICRLLQPQGDLSGLQVLVTAGGTREPIDPVRYISNRSSGKMGYALAQAALQRGARVTLVTAPTALIPPPGAEVVRVETARQMLEAVLAVYERMDVVIKAAAVADYRPARVAEHKIKKSEAALVLELEKNPDILGQLGRHKRPGVTLVGFAAETSDLLQNAAEKLRRKNLDLIVANDVTVPGAGFGSDTNIVKLLYADGRVQDVPQMDKLELAHLIWDEVLGLRRQAEQ